MNDLAKTLADAVVQAIATQCPVATGDKAREVAEAAIQQVIDSQSAGQERGEAVGHDYEMVIEQSGLVCLRGELRHPAGTKLYAHPPADAQRVAELERVKAEQLSKIGDLLRRNAALEAQLTESREREAKLIADLDANLEAFSDERKRALSAENLARELHELLADYVSQDSIAQGYGAGIGGTTYEKAEAFLDALAAEKE